MGQFMAFRRFVFGYYNIQIFNDAGLIRDLQATHSKMYETLRAIGTTFQPLTYLLILTCDNVCFGQDLSISCLQWKLTDVVVNDFQL